MSDTTISAANPATATPLQMIVTPCNLPALVMLCLGITMALLWFFTKMSKCYRHRCKTPNCQGVDEYQSII